MRHADVMCDAVRRLADAADAADAADPIPRPAHLAAAAQLEAGVAARIAEQTPAELARAVRRVVLCIDPDGGALRHAAALSERRVYTRPDDDGIASLTFTGAATDFAAVYGRIDAAARSLPADDPRRGTRSGLTCSSTRSCPACRSMACPPRRAERRRSRCASVSKRCWDWTTSPATWLGTARYRPVWPAIWPVIALARGAASSPIRTPQRRCTSGATLPAPGCVS